MAALLKLPEGTLEQILREAAQGEVVTAANLNSPDQIVIAGHVGAVNRAVELAKAAGAKRAVLLPVSAPFHCPLMQPARQRLATDLNTTTFSDLLTPLSTTGRREKFAPEVKPGKGFSSRFQTRFGGWTSSVT